MALVVPAVGNVLLLRYMVNHAVPNNCEMRLYNNNVIPSETDVLNTYTESTASNYTAVSLIGSNWSIAVGTSGATATYAQQNFNFSAADTIYGYYVTSAGKQNLLWSELFVGGPFIIPGSGQITVLPKISLD